MSIDRNYFSEDEIFENYIKQLQSYKKQLNDVTSNKNDPDNVIETYNESIEKKDEAQKFEFRDKLLKLISKLIWVQLFFFNIVILIVISSVVFNFTFIKNLEADVSITILDF